MYANFIYFIIVLLIYTTYQPSEETPFDSINTFLLFIGLILFFCYRNQAVLQSTGKTVRT